MKSYRIDIIEHAPGQAARLFGLIGELACLPATHKALGACVTSEPGRIWIIAHDDSACLGFVSIHRLASGREGQVRHLFAVDGPQTVGVLGHLLQAITKEAKARGLRTLSSVDRAAAGRLYATHGWQAGHTRGQYITYHWEDRHAS